MKYSNFYEINKKCEKNKMRVFDLKLHLMFRRMFEHFQSTNITFEKHQLSFSFQRCVC